MRITILTVPGCPNATLIRDRVAAAVGNRQADIEYIEVHDAEEAAARGMTGSPTVLVNDADLTGVPAAPGFACRLDIPSTARLGAALDRRLGSPDGPR